MRNGVNSQTRYLMSKSLMDLTVQTDFALFQRNSQQTILLKLDTRVWASLALQCGEPCLSNTVYSHFRSSPSAVSYSRDFNLISVRSTTYILCPTTHRINEVFTPNSITVQRTCTWTFIRLHAKSSVTLPTDRGMQCQCVRMISNSILCVCCSKVEWAYYFYKYLDKCYSALQQEIEDNIFWLSLRK